MITRIEYEAYRHYLVERDTGWKINGDDSIFERYLKWYNASRTVSVDFQLENTHNFFFAESSEIRLPPVTGKIHSL